jgi:carbohydrate kinase (thermoresistant glucokinase family)
MRLVVMGVSGAGKSTVGRRLAEHLGAAFVDSDDLHPAGNRAKITNNIPLTDTDRWPWLRSVHDVLQSDDVVVACSALKRSYRDLLRQVGDILFVFLEVPRECVEARVGARQGHFAGPGLVDSQFATLERPHLEPDVIVIDASGGTETAVKECLDRLGDPVIDQARPLLAVGSIHHDIDESELSEHLEAAIEQIHLSASARVLVVPPDHTRAHSGAGTIVALLYDQLTAGGCTVRILPALGTHTSMTPDELRRMFGDRVPTGAFLRHDWQYGTVSVGALTRDEVSDLSGGLLSSDLPIELNSVLFDGWDLIVSVGQVVPHEVIGMANYSKNLVIGLGGASLIGGSHLLGALFGIEHVLGRTSNPVRALVDLICDRFIVPRLNVAWVLTVCERLERRTAMRGVFVGSGGSLESGGAAFRDAAVLSGIVNVARVDAPQQRVVCWLNANEYRSTWLGNKAIYRTRPMIADGGELIVLAPGVRKFGEADGIDALIRRHGYVGRAGTLDAARQDPDLAANPAATAHLIHGSPEGRFRVVYCTDPDEGGLGAAELEAVGFSWRSLPEEMAALGVDKGSTTGVRLDATGDEFYFVSDPATGLWELREPREALMPTATIERETRVDGLDVSDEDPGGSDVAS